MSLLRDLFAQRGRRDSAHGVAIGLIGRGIQSSRSPAMHEREGARLGIDYVYALIDFDRLGLADDDLGVAVAAAHRLGVAGLNVTHPFKQAVLAHVDELADDAAAIGAVNTIVLGDGRAAGHNTDCFGFAQSFREGLPDSPMDRVLLVGAGGAGAAVAHALLELGGADVVIADAAPERAFALSARLAARFPGRVRASSADANSIPGASGVVNATPVGMAKYPGTPLPTDLLSPDQWVAEIVYFPAETELLRRARAIGCRTLSGRRMAVHQAARAFELFTGRPADRAAMARHFEAVA